MLSLDPMHDLLFPASLNRTDHLLTLIELFEQGRRCPDAFFGDAAFACLQQAVKAKASKRPGSVPLTYTIATMKERLEKPYEPELRRLFRDENDLTRVFNEDFAAYCESRLLPVWEAVRVY